MPRLNSTGPEGKGPGTGRGLGRCKKQKDEQGDAAWLPGKGMGERRRSEKVAGGKGRRLKSGKLFENKK